MGPTRNAISKSLLARFGFGKPLPFTLQQVPAGSHGSRSYASYPPGAKSHHK